MARAYILKSPFSDPPQEDFPAPPPERPEKIYTVSELTQIIEELFRETFAYGIWVEGEISDPKLYPSGHLWFDLKDSQATMKSVMWRDDVRRLKFRLEQGLQVVCFGRLDFYAQRGEVKFVARSIEPKGLGALQLAFEQLKERLQKDGLFAEERKRPLPTFPQRIGIVTSPRGAAIDDMLKVLRGHVQIILAPSRVQGERAAEAIADGIRSLNGLDHLDLLIVGRGGGSLEDLWAFNEEAVARAIAGSRLPVISAVGHEKDVTISDLVADLRAPTPTKGAEMVLAQRRQALDRFLSILENTALTEPREWLKEYEEKIKTLQGELLASSPQAVILHQSERLHRFTQTLETGMRHRLEQLAAHLSGLAGRLNALSPLAVLKRGYSITFDAQGKVLREHSAAQLGDLIRTKLHRGELTSRVESIDQSQK